MCNKCLCRASIQAEDDPSEARPGERKMTFKPPQLTEEEQDEVFLPKAMRCDGCQVRSPPDLFIELLTK